MWEKLLAHAYHQANHTDFLWSRQLGGASPKQPSCSSYRRQNASAMLLATSSLKALTFGIERRYPQKNGIAYEERCLLGT